MQPTHAKDPQHKRGKTGGSVTLEQEVDQLTATALEVLEEIELVSRGGATLEDIEGAKVLASSVLEKYEALMKRLSRAHREKLQPAMTGMVERIKKGLTQLKEAPE